MATSPLRVESQHQPPGRPPIVLALRTIGLRGLWGLWTFYWPNALWSVVYFALHHVSHLSLLLNARRLADLLLLTYLYPLVWERPILGWPSFISLLILIWALYHRYVAYSGRGGIIYTPPTSPTINVDVQESQRLDELSHAIRSLAAQVERLTQKFNELFPPPSCDGDDCDDGDEASSGDADHEPG